MKASILNPSAMASVIMLSSLFHTVPVLCDGCPAPSFVSVRAFDFDGSLRPQSLAVGDFNGDGRPDLAVANNGSTNVSVLLGNGDGTFQNAFGYGAGTGPGSVAVGDFNGDGKPDLAVANIGSLRDNYTDGNVSVLLGNGDGTFRSAVDYGAGSVPRSVTVGDFNGDGKLDLAVANFYCGTTSGV